MLIRRSGRLLLCSVALAAAGCSSDSMRFSDMYPGGPAGADPMGMDARPVGSIGGAPGPAYAPGHGSRPPAATPADAPVPGADVAPRGPAGWLAQQTRNPLIYGGRPARPSYPVQPSYPAAEMAERPVLDRAPTGSVGVGPVRSTVTSRALAPVARAASADPVASNRVVAAASQPRTVLEKARAALPRMPRIARTSEPVDPRPLAARVTAAKSAVGWSGEGGRVTVGEGQTLYNLSKRFGVPVAAIMAANGISDPTTVKIGQSLVIPRYTYDRSAGVSAPDADPNVRAATAGRGMIGEVSPDRVPLPGARATHDVTYGGAYGEPAAAPVRTASLARPAQPARPVFSATRTVTVGSGDTLYSIARRSGTTVDALRSANDIPGDAIRVGQVLSLPGAGGTVVAAATPAEPVAVREPVVVASASARSPVELRAAPEPRVVASAAVSEPPSAPSLPRTNPPVAAPAEPALDTIQTASIPTTALVAAPQSTGAMRRPVDGRIIRRFGGAQKGIDISVPSGSPVRAAENGTVIYAGSGLKEFGKTVLIQHADGLVTVYGHADALKVAKGQKVKRGDVIASSGMTGQAETPRVHFQVRKGSTPVDPEAFL